MLVQDFISGLACCELTASQLVATATRSDTGLHNRLDLIQSIVPPHYMYVMGIYYIWCGFRTISLAKSVTWYTEYLMYFFHCEETRRFYFFLEYWCYVSIFKYIDAMLLNLDPDIVRSGPHLHSRYTPPVVNSFLVLLCS